MLSLIMQGFDDAALAISYSNPEYLLTICIIWIDGNTVF